MKPLFVFAFLLVTAIASSQTVSGFYSGTLYNDTTKLIQQYELALSEYRGKITGYSYVTFVINDTFYYGIRKVTGHIQDNKLIVKDDKFIANNFPESPAKGVKRLFVIPLDGSDTLRNISGNWQTNRTKKYYSVPGTVTASRSTDSAGSALFAHLQELELIPKYAIELDTKLSVARKNNEKARETETERLKQAEAQAKKEADIKNAALLKEAEKEKAIAARKKQEEKEAEAEREREAEREKARLKEAEALAKKQAEQRQAAIDRATAANTAAEKEKAAAAKRQLEKEEAEREKERIRKEREAEALAKKQEEERKAIAAKQLEAEKAAEKEKEIQKKQEEEAKNNALKNTVTTTTAAITPFDQRGKREMKTIEVTTDTLVLSFYDNGVIDGDSISVYANGENIVSNIRLAATATRKKIAVPASGQTEIMLVAENLGTIPPNTGLLMITDGDQSYQLHFTADLKTNASVIIKKKKK